MPLSTRQLLLVPVAVAALAATGCSLADDGPRTTEARHVPAFTRVENRGAVDVQLHVGEPRRVRVRAGMKVIDDVRTEVRNGTLVVTFEHDGFFDSDVVVDASVPRLAGVENDGSGDIDADGTAGAVTLDLDGSGDVDLSALRARSARVTQDGSGDAEVSARKRLDVSVDGSGDLRYHGHPVLTKHVDGSGELIRGY